MFKRLKCWKRGHDTVYIPAECFKKEYNLPYHAGKVCIWCGKIDLAKNKPHGLTREEQAIHAFGLFLTRNHTAYRGYSGRPACPLPWDNPPTLSDDDF